MNSSMFEHISHLYIFFCSLNSFLDELPRFVGEILFLPASFPTKNWFNPDCLLGRSTFPPTSPILLVVKPLNLAASTSLPYKKTIFWSLKSSKNSPLCGLPLWAPTSISAGSVHWAPSLRSPRKMVTWAWLDMDSDSSDAEANHDIE